MATSFKSYAEQLKRNPDANVTVTINSLQLSRREESHAIELVDMLRKANVIVLYSPRSESNRDRIVWHNVHLEGKSSVLAWFLNELGSERFNFSTVN